MQTSHIEFATLTLTLSTSLTSYHPHLLGSNQKDEKHQPEPKPYFYANSQPEHVVSSSLSQHVQKGRENADDGQVYVQTTEDDVRRSSVSQRATVYTQLKTMQLVMLHAMFPTETNNASKTSVVEHRMSSGILSEKEPGLATIKQKTTNCGFRHPFLKRDSDVMAGPKMS